MIFIGGGQGWIGILVVIGGMLAIPLLAHAFFRLFAAPSRPDHLRNQKKIPQYSSEKTWRCPKIQCQARNPSHARYCRLCGREHQNESFTKII